MSNDSILFQPLKIGRHELRNRLLMAPMTRSRADDQGVPSELVPTYYAQRAGAGLIISEGIYPSPMGKGYVRTPGIHSDAQVAAWKNVTDAVHAKGGLIFAQIMHAGRISDPSFLPGGATPVAPSAVRPSGQSYTNDGLKPHVTPRALALDEIPGVVAEYAQATRRALDAGFDGVELHAASGYLPMQFLSSGTNLRSDRYGGGAQNRARFIVEALEAMAQVAGADRVGIKLSPEMPFNDVSDADPRETYTTLARAIGALGLAYLHVTPFGKETDYHALLRPLFSGPYLAGAGLTKETAERLVRDGIADAAVFGTLFLANPDLPERFRHGAALNAPDQSTFYSPGAKGYIDYPTLEAA
ncbi:MAG TPA: alkene reductase [Pelomicrobium sp.]|nr:alkene reductase [Pelomicrobium sp.]